MLTWRQSARANHSFRSFSLQCTTIVPRDVVTACAYWTQSRIRLNSFNIFKHFCHRRKRQKLRKNSIRSSFSYAASNTLLGLIISNVSSAIVSIISMSSFPFFHTVSLHSIPLSARWRSSGSQPCRSVTPPSSSGPGQQLIPARDQPLRRRSLQLLEPRIPGRVECDPWPGPEPTHAHPLSQILRLLHVHSG